LWPGDLIIPYNGFIEETFDKLDYLTAGKIYVNEYIRLHKNVDDFHILQENLQTGKYTNNRGGWP
jgi:hypothetical protein